MAFYTPGKENEILKFASKRIEMKKYNEWSKLGLKRNMSLFYYTLIIASIVLFVYLTLSITRNHEIKNWPLKKGMLRANTIALG